MIDLLDGKGGGGGPLCLLVLLEGPPSEKVSLSKGFKGCKAANSRLRWLLRLLVKGLLGTGGVVSSSELETSLH